MERNFRLQGVAFFINFLFWPSDVSTDFSHNPSYGAFFRRRWKCQQDLPSLHFPIGSARWGTKKRSFELP